MIEREGNYLFIYFPRQNFVLLSFSRFLLALERGKRKKRDPQELESERFCLFICLS